jgi:hypothetical protein
MEKFMYVTARGKQKTSWAVIAITLAFVICLALSAADVPKVFAAEVESEGMLGVVTATTGPATDTDPGINLESHRLVRVDKFNGTLPLPDLPS